MSRITKDTFLDIYVSHSQFFLHIELGTRNALRRKHNFLDA